MTLDDLRRFAVTQSLFPPTTLRRAIERLGFVQADPIRAPARAQDLTLRHRVQGYRAGDLERRYATLGVEEDVFVNYGFISPSVEALMHPRSSGVARSAVQRRRAAELLEFVRARGTVHPRDVDAHFAHGTVTNYWGGSSSATTHLLEDMHYRGLLRIARREAGVRIYASTSTVPVLPMPASATHGSTGWSMSSFESTRRCRTRPCRALVNRLRYATPQWRSISSRPFSARDSDLPGRRSAAWTGTGPRTNALRVVRHLAIVRLLAPFDPVVWDRRRFEMLWGWPYRFEAYTPLKKRTFGYYALPLLWGDRVIGWGNLSVKDGTLRSAFGYVGDEPGDPAFVRERDAELERVRAFLGLAR